MTAAKLASIVLAAVSVGPSGACGTGAREVGPRPVEPLLVHEIAVAPPWEHGSPALTPQQLAELPVGQMSPFAEELLDRPIELEGCPGVRIVEWRPTAGREATTGPTRAAVEVLSSVCAVAVDAFEGFVAGEVPFPVPVPVDWRVDVSLLPTGHEGPVARTLADHEGRFARREKTLTPGGGVLRIGGYTDFVSGQVFVPCWRAPPMGLPRRAPIRVRDGVAAEAQGPPITVTDWARSPGAS